MPNILLLFHSNLILTLLLFFKICRSKPEQQVGFRCTNLSETASSSYGCALTAEKIKFFVVGDIGGVEEPGADGAEPRHSPSEGQRAVAQLMQRVAAQHHNGAALSFVLNLGDNFYENGVTPSDVARRFKQNFVDVFGNVGDASVPWYTIAGNKDYNHQTASSRNSPIQSQIEFPTGKWTFPAPYYTIHYNFGANLNAQIRLVMIDSVILCGRSRKDFTDAKQKIEERKIRDSKSHFDWLEQQLREARQKNVDFLFVAGHFPAYIIAGPRAFGCSVRLQELLREYNVDAYFAGHEHNLKYVGGDTPQIIAGAGSRMENAIYDKHVTRDTKKLLHFWYPDDVGTGTVRDGGGFVQVELDKSTAKIHFHAAGHIYHTTEAFSPETGTFARTFMLKSKRAKTVASNEKNDGKREIRNNRPEKHQMLF